MQRQKKKQTNPGSQNEGTWLLDRLTREDQPDFMLLCSSVATTFSALTMGDYVAANAYLDTFAAQRSKEGFHTLAINWTTWRKRHGSAFWVYGRYDI